jgi:hypothetical protein
VWSPKWRCPASQGHARRRVLVQLRTRQTGLVLGPGMNGPFIPDERLVENAVENPDNC